MIKRWRTNLRQFASKIGFGVPRDAPLHETPENIASKRLADELNRAIDARIAAILRERDTLRPTRK